MISTIRDFIDERAKQEPNTVYMIAPEARLTLTYGQLQEDSINLWEAFIETWFTKGR